MRSTELRDFALPITLSSIGSMCFKVDGVIVNFRRLRDAAVLTLISVPRLVSFSNISCSLGAAPDTSCHGCFCDFWIGGNLPQLSRDPTTLATNAPRHLTDCATRDGRGRQDKNTQECSSCYAWVVILAWRIAWNCPSYSWTPTVSLFICPKPNIPPMKDIKDTLFPTPPPSPLGLGPPPCLPFIRLRVYEDPLPCIPTLPVTTCRTHVNNLYPPV
ncbi:hypothetical protein BC827DRAFT_622391 [Russula dissimulans]|nr:hypothetical protein BC827DRAFT_622391 [Russula dissimulans]